MKAILTTLVLFLSLISQGQSILFTDAHLKSAIIAEGVDTNGDGQISISEARAVTGTLDLSSSNISNITGLSYFINVTSLNLGSNQITGSVSFTNNTELASLDLSNNQISRINISGLTNLLSIGLDNNLLKGVHTNTNSALLTFLANNNQISSVDFQHNRNIQRIDINHNEIKELDLHGLTELRQLDCSFNELTTLNLRNVNPSIVTVLCNDNHLVNFDYANGTDGPLIELNAVNNDDLSCMTVSDPSTFYHPSGTLPPGTSLSTSCEEQIYIPDIWFEFDLIQQGLDTGNGGVIDHKISVAEALNIVNLDISGTNTTGSDITDLSGIEHFDNLITLNARDNNISNVDLTQNINLQQLRLDDNNLSDIDISTLINLTNLRLKNNNINSIDVSNNVALENLDVNGNNLTSLDLTHNTALTSLYGQNNQIASVNLFNNSGLVHVNLSNNLLTSIIFNNHPDLQRVYCEGNNMTGIYISSTTTNLLELKLNNNRLENSNIIISSSTLQVIEANNNLLSGELDLKDLASLTNLTLANNVNLETIKLQNGNNSSITEFDATGCTNLTTICVDDAAWSASASGWSVDNTNVYSTCVIDIPDSNFEQALIDLGIDTNHDAGSPDVPNGMINSYDIEDVTFLNVENKGIHNFSGIEYFTDLISLYISDNPLTTTTIDLSNLSSLEIFFADNCNLDTYYLTLPTSGSLLRLSLNDNFDLETHGFDALISDQTGLKYLSFTDNNVVSIDVTNFPNIEELYCSNNPDYEELDLSNATHLTRLEANNCHLDVVDLSACIALSYLDVSVNNIHTLSFGTISSIDFLRCSNNQLTTLDVSNLSSLDFIRCGINQLTTLDLSQNTNVTGVYAGDNLFTEVNLKNGYTSNMRAVWITNNPNLTCVQVDDASIDYSSISGNDWHYDTGISFSENCSGQTYVPDDNFEQALIDLGYDHILDDYVLTSNISTLTSINLNSKNIADFTGINDFVAMQYLTCESNPMISLDISNLTNLKQLTANNCNNLNSLTLETGNTIETIELNYCNFDSVYSIMQSSPALKYLHVGNNALTGDLELFGVNDLRTINAKGNNLEFIDFSETPLLESAFINDNPLLEELELNHLSHLTQLSANNCSLHTLEVKNGNNSAFTLFSALNNPVLTCIEVDNASWSTTNWTNIDSTASFNEDCSGGVTYVPDNGFEQALIDLGYDTSMDNYVITANITGITNLDLSNKSISSLTGIEDFESLVVLNVSDNNLHALNVYNSPGLKVLTANNNNLTSINTTNNPLLEVLRVNNNQLTTIELKFNAALKIFSGDGNTFTSINLNFNTNLEKVFVGNNQLESFDIQNGNNTNIITFFARNNPNLFCINVDDPAYSTTNWTNIDAQTGFDDHCGLTYVPDDNFEQYLISRGYDDLPDDYVRTDNINTITTLYLNNKNIDDLTGIEDFESLDYLSVRDNNLTGLDVRALSNLTKLKCNGNDLTNLQLPPSIIELEAQENQLTTLNLSFAANLTKVRVNNNLLTNIVLPSTSILEHLTIYNNQLSGINLSAQTHLEEIFIYDNNLSNIDLSNCASITFVSAGNNQLNTIDLTSITSIEGLYINDNNISSVDISAQTNLTELGIYNNQFTQIDVSHNPLLKWLIVSNNQLTQIDLSANPILEVLAVDDNQISILDLSSNPNLEAIYAQNNQLTQVDLRNGNNTIIDDTYDYGHGITITFYNNPNFTGNPNLTCIEVDDPAWSTSNWTDIDAQTSFNANCDTHMNVTVVGNGSVSSNPVSGTCYSGGSIELTATPDAGWEFAGWSGDVTGTTNSVTVTMDDDKYVTATFTQIQHTLSTNTVGNGSVSVSPSGSSFNEGDTVQITAVPDAGWQFSGWSGDYIGIDNPATVTMSADKNVTATFTQIEYTLDIRIVGNGSVSNSPNNTTYHYGDVVELTATPDSGWAFSEWQSDLSGNTNPESITIDDYKTITAVFTNTGAIDDDTLNQAINIYPNPTKNNINIDVADNLIIENISILNMEGKVLWQQENTENISLQNFERGMYLIKINTPKGTFIKRIIKE